jgi:hypothetical protein
MGFSIPGPSSDAVWGQDSVWPDIRDPVAEEASLLYKERYPAIMCFFPTKFTVHHGLERVKEYMYKSKQETLSVVVTHFQKFQTWILTKENVQYSTAYLQNFLRKLMYSLLLPF